MRFVADLREAGARLATQRLVGTPSLPVALGGVGISLADLTMLYVDLANGGVAAPFVYAGAASTAPRRQLMSSTAAWYVGDILAGSSRPDGWGEGIGLDLDAHHRLQDRHVLRLPRRLGGRIFAGLTPSASGSGAPTGRRAPAISAATPRRRSCSNYSTCCRPKRRAGAHRRPTRSLVARQRGAAAGTASFHATSRG